MANLSLDDPCRNSKYIKLKGVFQSYAQIL